MKKRIAALLIMLLSLSACGNKEDAQDVFGTYAFEALCYLSPLSSSTKDYFEEEIAGTKYSIENELFKIDDTDSTVEIKSPQYVREEVPNHTYIATDDGAALLQDVPSILGEDLDYRYNICNQDGSRTNWSLYIASDEVWIASFYNNAEDGSEIVRDIIKVSKSK